MKVIDLSHNLNNQSPSYPGDNKLELYKVANLINDGFNSFELKTNMHVGTHVEVAMHMSNSNKFISQYKVEDFFGRAKVLSFENAKEIDWRSEFDKIVEEKDIIIIYSNYSKKYMDDNYYTEHPILTNNFINNIVAKKIKMLALDFPSPDYSPYKNHQKLFSNDIIIVENLTNVDEIVKYNNIMFFAVPIKIEAESSLTRAFAICFE